VKRDPDNPKPAVKATATDTHCHLFLMEGSAEDSIEAAKAAGVGALICVGIDPRSSRVSLDLAEANAGVFATAGMHPHTASELDAAARAAIEALLGSPRVVAVGETGLDFYRRLSPAPEQEKSLRFHASLARETGKAMVVHVRDAWARALRILEEEAPPRVVLHCFSGDAATAAESAARGYFLSFAGPVTYPKNEHLRAAAAATPEDQLLVETDSPYLAPQALRGRDNTPANVGFVIEEVARARGETPDRVAETTSSNARAVFGLPE